MRVFVTGASGFIGSAVVAELLGAGHEVTGLARSTESAERVASLGAIPCVAQLADLDQLAAAASAADGVLHLAYRHGAPSDAAATTDRQAIEVIGEALAGSGRPLVVTSGTLVLREGTTAAESDQPDPASPGAARIAGERAALTLASRGVRACVVRLAPCVHERVRRGFVGALIDAAGRTGLSGYLGDGAQRWPAVHRRDAAALFVAALESAPAGTVLHGVAETGIPIRAIAELIGQRLNVPVAEVAKASATEHFGWIGSFVGTDAPASSERTRAVMQWTPSRLGLLDDLESGDFFQAMPS